MTTTVPLTDTRPLSVASWIRHHLSWVLVVAALAAASVLTTVVVLDDPATDAAPISRPSIFDADRGSIAAIDHRAATVVAPSGALHESIATIDHRAATSSSSSSGILHESVSAIDHRDAQSEG